MSKPNAGSQLKSLDLAFLLMEKPNRPMHMCSFMVFDLPPGAKRDFVRTVVAAFRASAIAAPFNQKPHWHGPASASLEAVEVDPTYHVRHIAVPKPGTLAQCFELVSLLNMNLLDRAHPLWECYVIEGMQRGQFAVMLKLHHAIVDGEAGLKMLRAALSEQADAADIKPLWAPFTTGKRRRTVPGKRDARQLTQMLSRMRNLPAELRRGLPMLMPASLTKSTASRAMPFSAASTFYNNQAQSADRRYASCELSLAELKQVGADTGTTVNDVVMTIVDAAMHRYAGTHGKPLTAPLVAMMPMSQRQAGDDSAGNKVGAQLVQLGSADAPIAERLRQISTSTNAVKLASSRLSPALFNLQTLLLTGGATLADRVPAVAAFPSANLVISNMVGPGAQLYMGGAALKGFHGLPILPPGGGINVTFASFNNTVSLAIAAAPEAVPDPMQIADGIRDAFNALRKTTQKKRNG